MKELCFFIDTSVLQQMFEGKDEGKSKEMMVMMKKMRDEGKPFQAKTSTSCFLRALYLADGEPKIQNIQKVLSFLQVIPSFADFKNEKEVLNEVLKIVKIMAAYGKK